MRNPEAEEINGISAYNVILTPESERMASHLIDGLNSVIGITATYHPIEIKVVGYDIDARIRFMVHNGVPCIKIGQPHGIFSYEETIGIFGLLMEKLSSNYTVERKNDSTAIVIECGESVLSEDGLRQLGQRIAEHIKNMFGDYASDLLKRYIEPHRGLLSMFEKNDALTLYDAITMDPVYYATYKSDYIGPSLYLVRSIAKRMLV